MAAGRRWDDAVGTAGRAQPQAADRRRRSLAVLLLAVGGYGLYDRFIREDTGVVVCKAMRARKEGRRQRYGQRR
ncbi:hypothetical protein [Micromonospora aurantiaca (nom. illeg.)]|uniref:Uncharacterized protein n=1 Tax=Micromonospora aurantiaca (nom. illeg.) TaxID=47850 RepID=A0A6N3K079_9ACTN|nr:hypothetical protein [Micromonospora aurantiaca]AXH91485.1 hypothetical protein DVH21_16995 [Micromonospora aurantiaca]